MAIPFQPTEITSLTEALDALTIYTIREVNRYIKDDYRTYSGKTLQHQKTTSGQRHGRQNTTDSIQGWKANQKAPRRNQKIKTTAAKTGGDKQQISSLN